jgi:hypothetical protein
MCDLAIPVLFLCFEVQFNINRLGYEFISEGAVVPVIHLPLCPIDVKIRFALYAVVIHINARGKSDVLGDTFESEVSADG